MSSFAYLNDDSLGKEALGILLEAAFVYMLGLDVYNVMIQGNKSIVPRDFLATFWAWLGTVDLGQDRSLVKVL